MVRGKVDTFDIGGDAFDLTGSPLLAGNVACEKQAGPCGKGLLLVTFPFVFQIEHCSD